MRGEKTPYASGFTDHGFPSSSRPANDAPTRKYALTISTAPMRIGLLYDTFDAYPWTNEIGRAHV